MEKIRKALLNRLLKIGIDPNLIPGFIRLTADALTGAHYQDLDEVNKRLHFLGWNDLELDYHTLQLIIANLEYGGFSASEAGTDFSIKRGSNPQSSAKAQAQLAS